MLNNFKPLLAGSIKSDDHEFNFPVVVSPKYDGIRAVIDDCVLSRSLKNIPNKKVQQLFGRAEFKGLDGELIVGDPFGDDVFNRTSSGVMSIEGSPNVTFFVFDDFSHPCEPFLERIRQIEKRKHFHYNCFKVPHVVVNNKKEFLRHEDAYLSNGYEGIMVRSPGGVYKFGRSTVKEAILLKKKPFDDAEAKIVGFNEMMTNVNKACENELGYKRRSSKKEGMVPAGTLGSLHVVDIITGEEFDLGTGFTADQRLELWRNRKSVIGKIVKYKRQRVGTKNAPRIPVAQYAGIRSLIDM